MKIEALSADFLDTVPWAGPVYFAWLTLGPIIAFFIVYNTSFKDTWHYGYNKTKIVSVSCIVLLLVAPWGVAIIWMIVTGKIFGFIIGVLCFVGLLSFIFRVLTS